MHEQNFCIHRMQILNQPTKERKILAFNIYAPLSMVSQAETEFTKQMFCSVDKTNFYFFLYMSLGLINRALVHTHVYLEAD